MPKDCVKAHARGNLAVAQGRKTAAKSYDRLATRMTAEYITQAHKHAAELFRHVGPAKSEKR